MRIATLTLPVWVKSLLKPVPVVLGVLASIAGIVGANYDFDHATIYVSVSEYPSEEQKEQIVRSVFLQSRLQNGTEAEKLSWAQEMLLPKNYPQDMLSYHVVVKNTSDYDANELTLKLALYDDDELLLEDVFAGEHDLKAKDGEIEGAIPITDEIANADEFAFCLAFRGRFYINFVEQRIRLATTALKNDDSDWRFWASYVQREKNLFVFSEPCQDWPR